MWDVISDKCVNDIRRGEKWHMDVISVCVRCVAGKWRQKLGYDEIFLFCLVHHISHTTIFVRDMVTRLTNEKFVSLKGECEI